MQTVASKSPLGWAVVHKLEGSVDFDKDIIDMDGEEVRKAEKDLVAYNSECTFPFDFLFILFFFAGFLDFYSSVPPGDIASAARAAGSGGVREQGGAGRKRKYGGQQQAGLGTSAASASSSGPSTSGQSGSSQSRGTRACYNCNSTSHIARACPKAKKKN